MRCWQVMVRHHCRSWTKLLQVAFGLKGVVDMCGEWKVIISSSEVRGKNVVRV